MPAPYLFSSPRDVYVELLHKASRDSEFSEIAARTSLLLDLDKGKPKSRADYARQWKWTPKRVRLHWPAIVQDVSDWITSYGRQTNTPHAKNLARWLDEQARLSEEMRAVKVGEKQGHGRGTDRGTETGLNGPENEGQGHGRGTGGARHTNNTPSTPETSSLNTYKARPRDLEEVRAYATERERPDLSEAFFDHHTARGWRTTQGPIRDWRAAFRTWQRFDDERRGKPPRPALPGDGATGPPPQRPRRLGERPPAEIFDRYDRL